MDLPINVDASIWCSGHRHQFPGSVPNVAGSVELTLSACKLPAIQEACTLLPSGKRDSRDLSAVLQAHSPLCCLVPNSVLQQVYKKAGVL